MLVLSALRITGMILLATLSACLSVPNKSPTMMNINSVYMSDSFTLITGSLGNPSRDKEDELCVPFAFSIVGHERTYTADDSSSKCQQHGTAPGTITQFDLRFPAGILPGKYMLRFKHLSGDYAGMVEEHAVMFKVQ